MAPSKIYFHDFMGGLNSMNAVNKCIQDTSKKASHFNVKNNYGLEPTISSSIVQKVMDNPI